MEEPVRKKARIEDPGISENPEWRMEEEMRKKARIEDPGTSENPEWRMEEQMRKKARIEDPGTSENPEWRMEEPVRKKARIEDPGTSEKPGTSKNNDTKQSNENSLVSDNSLPYDILRMIFEYLNGKDLAKAAMVCRPWLEAANQEKRMRGPYCFLILNHLSNRNAFLNFIRFKPSIIFIFSYKYFKYGATLVKEHMSLLPTCSEAVVLPGLCFTDKTLRWNTKFAEQSPVCVLLPQIPNVRIKSFILTIPESGTIQETTEYREIMNTINNHKTMLNCETSTCFMLFSSMEGDPTAFKWTLTILNRKEIAIDALCKGMCDNVFFKYPDNLYKSTSERKEPHCVAVLITGLIQTWFTTLHYECNTTEQIEAILKLFKDEVKLKKHSIGFIFIGEDHRYFNYETSNYKELIIFKRLFPELPLAGCFGTFEIRSTTRVEEEEVLEDSRRGLFDFCCNFDGRSSTFLILTYD